MNAPSVQLRPGRRGTDAASAWVRALRLRLFKTDADGNQKLVNTGIPAKDAKHLLLTLAQYVDHNGACFPSFQTLSDDTEMSWDSIKRRLADLEYLRLIVRFRRWRTSDGKINDDGRGRETSGEIRFMFDTTQEEVDALLQARADNKPVEGDDGEPLDGELGCADSVPKETELGCADSAPGVGTAAHPYMNPSLEQDSPPKPPQSPADGPQGLSDEEVEERVPFHRFETSYPIPILKPAAARSIWSALTDSEREQAIEGARGYARFLDREKRRAMDAHKWLREKLWTQFAAERSTAGGRVFVAEDEGDYGDWVIAYQLRGYADLPYFLRVIVNGKRGIMVPTRCPPLGAGMPKFSRETWRFVPQGDNRWWAWRERLVAAFGEGVRFLARGKADGVECSGAWFPSDWPPRKDGTILETTGPPPALTDTDLDELQRTG